MQNSSDSEGVKDILLETGPIPYFLFSAMTLVSQNRFLHMNRYILSIVNVSWNSDFPGVISCAIVNHLEQKKCLWPFTEINSVNYGQDIHV